MNEFSLASQILETVLDYVNEEPSREVRTIKLEIGELMCIDADQLRFCFDSIKQLTPVKNATLSIHFMPAEIKCHGCQYAGRPKYMEAPISGQPVATLQCPKCGRVAEASHGHDCVIKSIKFESTIPETPTPTPAESIFPTYAFDFFAEG